MPTTHAMNPALCVPPTNAETTTGPVLTEPALPPRQQTNRHFEPLRVQTRVYLALLIALGIGLAAIALTAVSGSTQGRFGLAIAMTAFMVIAWLFPLPFAFQSKLYLDTCVICASILLFDPAMAMMIATGGTITAHLIRRLSAGELVFNAAQTALQTVAGGLILAVSGWDPQLIRFARMTDLVAALVAGLAMYLVNTLSLAGVIALQSEGALLQVWRDSALDIDTGQILSHLSQIGIGVAAAITAGVQPWAVIFLVPPSVAVYVAFSRSLQLRNLFMANAEVGSDDERVDRVETIGVEESVPPAGGLFEIIDRATEGPTPTPPVYENRRGQSPIRNDLTLNFQPIVALRSGRIEGFEALVSWRNPMPNSIPSVGFWVLGEACVQARRWQEKTRRLPPSVSVNISSRQFTDPGLVDEIVRVLRETALNPRALHLEIAETALFADVELTIETLRRLKAIGVQTVIDDFGSGYSSLMQLRRFPIDMLKIDRSFVAGLGRAGEDSSIAKAIVAIGHTLGHIVIADGIETVGQLLQLCSLGCELGQGYHFAKPMAAAEAESLLASDSLSLQPVLSLPLHDAPTVA